MISSKLCYRTALLVTFAGLTAGTALCQVMTKPQVANLIAKVENGVDQFRDYLNRQGENAQASASSNDQAQARRSRRGTASDSQKANARAKKDELNDSLEDLAKDI